MSPIPLPVLSCEGCGRCCDTQGTPPGFASFFPVKGEIASWVKESEDARHFAKLPEEAREILEVYFRDHFLGLVGDRYDESLPCLFYDVEKKTCRFYDARPQTCREFELGSESCLGYRAEDRS